MNDPKGIIKFDKEGRAYVSTVVTKEPVEEVIAEPLVKKKTKKGKK